LWEANELFDYWQDYPPTHVLVAAYLTGNKKSSTAKSRTRSNSSLSELTQAVFSAGGNAGRELPAVYKT
jgi:hypothetical protein